MLLHSSTPLTSCLCHAGAIICGVSTGIGVLSAGLDKIQEKARRAERRLTSSAKSDEEFEAEEKERVRLCFLVAFPLFSFPCC